MRKAGRKRRGEKASGSTPGPSGQIDSLQNEQTCATPNADGSESPMLPLPPSELIVESQIKKLKLENENEIISPTPSQRDEITEQLKLNLNELGSGAGNDLQVKVETPQQNTLEMTQNTLEMLYNCLPSTFKIEEAKPTKPSDTLQSESRSRNSDSFSDEVKVPLNEVKDAIKGITANKIERKLSKNSKKVSNVRKEKESKETKNSTVAQMPLQIQPTQPIIPYEDPNDLLEIQPTQENCKIFLPRKYHQHLCIINTIPVTPVKTNQNLGDSGTTSGPLDVGSVGMTGPTGCEPKEIGNVQVPVEKKEEASVELLKLLKLLTKN